MYNNSAPFRQCPPVSGPCSFIHIVESIRISLSRHICLYPKLKTLRLKLASETCFACLKVSRWQTQAALELDHSQALTMKKVRYTVEFSSIKPNLFPQILYLMATMLVISLILHDGVTASRCQGA